MNCRNLFHFCSLYFSEIENARVCCTLQRNKNVVLFGNDKDIAICVKK